MSDKLELQLRRQIQKYRLIWGLVTLAGFALLLLFAAVRDTDLIILLVLPGIFAITFGLVFFFASFFCRIESTRSGADVITVYRGLGSDALYVNGQERDRTGLGRSYYLEARLSDGSTVTVAFARWYSFRLTFSNGQPPVQF